MSKYFKYLIISFFLTNCATKTIVDKRSSLDERYTIQYMQKVGMNEDKVLIAIGSGFNNHVQILSKNIVVYDRKIETLEQLGIAGSKIVSNKDPITIIIDSKTKLKLNAKKLLQFKFIEISYNKGYTIEYTNRLRGLH